jgi:ribosomal protein L25 (general stress protein Ctc)
MKRRMKEGKRKAEREREKERKKPTIQFGKGKMGVAVKLI